MGWCSSFVLRTRCWIRTVLYALLCFSLCSTNICSEEGCCHHQSASRVPGPWCIMTACNITGISAVAWLQMLTAKSFAFSQRLSVIEHSASFLFPDQNGPCSWMKTHDDMQWSQVVVKDSWAENVMVLRQNGVLGSGMALLHSWSIFEFPEFNLDGGAESRTQLGLKVDTYSICFAQSCVFFFPQHYMNYLKRELRSCLGSFVSGELCIWWGTVRCVCFF